MELVQKSVVVLLLLLFFVVIVITIDNEVLVMHNEGLSSRLERNIG